MNIKGFYIELLNICNLCCPYCYNDSAIDNELKIIPLDKIFLIVNFCKKNKISTITLSGGEPTLHPFIKEIIQFINANGINVNMITNLSTNIIDYEDFYANGNTLQITFDSIYRENHNQIRGNNNYESITKHINKFKKNINQIVVRFNLRKNNVLELNCIENFTHKLGIKNIYFNYLNSNGRASNFDDLIDLLDFNTCKSIEEKIGKINSSDEFCNYQISPLLCTTTCPIVNEIDKIEIFPRIDFLGNIYLCQGFSKRSLGNIYNAPLDDILNPQKVYNVIHTEHSNLIFNKKCSDCFFIGLCNGGCLDKDDHEYCKLYKDIILETMVGI